MEKTDPETGLEYDEVLSVAERARVQEEKIKDIAAFLKADDGTLSHLLDKDDPRGVPTKLTEHKVEAFLKLYEIIGNRYKACRAVGLSYDSVKKTMKNHPRLSAAIEESQQMYQASIISELNRRGRDGVKKNVYYKGEVVGAEIEYSDRCLELLATSLIPQFSRQKEIEAATTLIQLNFTDGTTLDVNNVKQLNKPTP